VGERNLAMSVLVDTNILIYHTQGMRAASEFLATIIASGDLNISILTKIEFLGWDKHTPEGFEKCKRLIEIARILPVGDVVADRAIELKRKQNIKLADAIIAATALTNDLQLATRNMMDFKSIEGIQIVNPFS
jgi:toxin FitB